jgi:DNA-binding transcriptional regulator YiaG
MGAAAARAPQRGESMANHPNRNWRRRLAGALESLPDPTPERIREARGGFSRELVAAWLDVAYRTYQDWELGTAKMPRSAWELMHVKLELYQDNKPETS